MVESLRDKVYALEAELSREKTVKEAAVNKLYKLIKNDRRNERKESENSRLSVRSKLSDGSFEKSSQERNTLPRNFSVAETEPENHENPQKQRQNNSVDNNTLTVDDTDSHSRRSSFDALKTGNSSRNLRIIEHKYVKLKESCLEMERGYKSQIERLEMEVHDLELQLEVFQKNGEKMVDNLDSQYPSCPHRSTLRGMSSVNSVMESVSSLKPIKIDENMENIPKTSVRGSISCLKSVISSKNYHQF